MKSGILLDVDGTLWDAVKAITESWNEYTRKFIPEVPGPFTDQDIQDVLGKTMLEIVDILYPGLSGERKQEVIGGIMQYEVDYLSEHAGVVYPGVAETVRRLKMDGYHLYIVSNCQKGYIEDFLKASELEDAIEDHVCFGDTLKSKDFSIRLCAERNHLDRALYVGDTAGDLSATRKAGFPFIYAAYGFGSVDAGKEKVERIGTFAELPDAVKRVWGE